MKTLEYYSIVQRVVDFIENNLTEPITPIQVAEKAFCSQYHFHWIFQAMAEDSIMEYIRKRRLTEVMTSKERIMDIALKYQYQTPESFTRALRRLFHISPT